MDERKRNILWAFAGLCCLNLIASLDTTALSVCIPTIATELKATSIQAYWTGTSFILASAVFQPVISALSAPFGRRPMIQLSLVLFAIGTIVCATAHHIATLLLGRTLQGVGGGGMLTMTYVVMADLLTLRERARGIAVLAAVWLVGTMVGPIMGGGFTSHVTWRWIFWIVLPLAGVGVVLTQLGVRTPHQPDYSLQGLKKVDWFGSALFVATLTSFLVAISWGGTQFAWSKYQTLVPLILGAVGISWWLMYEHYVPSNPMLPLAILSDRTALIGFVTTLLMGIVQFALLYFLPLYFQAAKGYSALISGVALLPLCMGACLTALTFGTWISRKGGRYTVASWIGWILLVLGSGIAVLLDTKTSIPAWIFITFVGGLGLGCQYASLPSASQVPQKEENMAMASGLTPFFRAIGQAFGIAISDAIYQNRLKQYLLDAVSPYLQGQADELAKSAASIVVKLQSLPTERVELLDAFNKSLHAIWWTMMGISVLGGILSLFMKEISLDRSASATSESVQNGTEMAGKSDHFGPVNGTANGHFAGARAYDGV